MCSHVSCVAQHEVYAWGHNAEKESGHFLPETFLKAKEVTQLAGVPIVQWRAARGIHWLSPVRKFS